MTISRSFDEAIAFNDTGKLSWYLLEEKVEKSNSRSVVRTDEGTMEPKAILIFVLFLSLVNPGSTFVYPRPQLIEFSQDYGFLRAFKNMLGIETDQDKNQINPDQFELLRKKLRCATWANYYQLPHLQDFCLDSLDKKKALKPQRHIYDYGLF